MAQESLPVGVDRTRDRAAIATDRVIRFLLHRLFPGLILLVIGVVVVYMAVFAPFESGRDTNYNIGLIRRTLVPNHRYLLETSVALFHFEALPIPRAEDWHRGLSFLLTSVWARIAGDDLTTLRLPHLLFLAAWIGISVGMLRHLLKRAPSLWLVIALCMALFLSTWSNPVVRNAIMDDLPGAVCALAGVYALMRFDASDHRAPVFAAFFMALAVWMKDFYMHWAFTGTLVVFITGYTFPAPQRLRRAIVRTVAFMLVFGVLVGLKLLWGYLETGAIFNSPALYWWNADVYGQGAVDNHYPFFLYDDDRYGSMFALAGTTENFLRGMLHHAIRDVYVGLVGLAFAWVLLIPWLFIQRANRPWSRQHEVLATSFFVAIIIYILFLSTGVGGPLQNRYWIAPVTLAVVLGVAALPPLFAQLSFPLSMRLVTGFALVAVYSPVANFENVVNTLLAVPEPPYYPQAVIDYLDEHLGPEDAAMFDRTGGFYYWSIRPEDRTVGFETDHLLALTPEQIVRLMDTYRIRYVVEHRIEAAEWLLETGVFDLIDDINGVTIIEYQPQPANVETIYRFGDAIRLVNWSLEGDASVAPCATVKVESWWMTDTDLEQDYSLRLSLIGPDGAGLANTDDPPASRSTSVWEPNRLYLDVRELTVPCDVEPGEYPLVTWIFEPDPYTSLPVTISDGTEVGDGYLTTLTVGGR